MTPPAPLLAVSVIVSPLVLQIRFPFCGILEFAEFNTQISNRFPYSILSNFEQFTLATFGISIQNSTTEPEREGYFQKGMFMFEGQPHKT